MTRSRPKILGKLRGSSGSASSDYGRTAGFLAVGVGLTGVITYTYFFIASHVLSKSDYGEITVLWSAVFITVSTLYRPVDQLLSRHISENLAKGEPVREPVLVATKIQLSLAATFAVVTLALRGPIQDGLLTATKPSTGSSSRRSSSTPPATSPAATSPATAGSACSRL